MPSPSVRRRYTVGSMLYGTIDIEMVTRSCSDVSGILDRVTAVHLAAATLPFWATLVVGIGWQRLDAGLAGLAGPLLSLATCGRLWTKGLFGCLPSTCTVPPAPRGIMG